MNREEITNSQDYKATKVALCWYPTLSDEQREDMDIVDAYSDGVIYGWNNPNWIKIEDGLPPTYNQPCYAPNGICTNPQMDCIICPKRGDGGTWSTSTNIKTND